MYACTHVYSYAMQNSLVAKSAKPSEAALLYINP